MNFFKVLFDYTKPELLILAVAIYGLGMLLAKVTTVWNVIGNYYSIIALGLGVVFSILYVCVVLGGGFSGAVVVSAIVQGVLVACVAVFGYEAIKSIIAKKKKK